MPPVHVILIGGVNHPRLIRAEHDVFHIKIAGCEQGRRAAGGSDRIQVIAPILLRGKNHAPIGGNVERAVFAVARQRILDLLSAAPQEPTCAGGGIGDPQRPRLRAYRNQRQLRLISRGPYEDNPPPVRRPARHGILIHARRQVADGTAIEVVNRNQAMTFPPADERDVFAIGRPLRLARRSAHRGQFLGLLFAVHTGNPQFLLRGPHRPRSVGRNLNIFAIFLGATHVTQQPRRRVFAIHIQREHLLLGAFRPALRIGTLLRVVQLAAQRIERRLGVRRESQAGDRLSVVRAVMGKLSRSMNKIRTVRHPHIANTLCVKHPRYAAAVRSRRQLARKRRTHHLLKRERRLAPRGRSASQDETNSNVQTQSVKRHRPLG